MTIVSNRGNQAPHEQEKPTGATKYIQVQMFRCTSRSWRCRWKSGGSSSVTGASVSRHLRHAGATVFDATGGVSAVPAFTARVSLGGVFCGDTLWRRPGGRPRVSECLSWASPPAPHLPHLPSHPGS